MNNQVSGGAGVDGSGGSSNKPSQDIKGHFVTREGNYRNLPAYEYSRPNRPTLPSSVGQNSQPANLPVKISLVHLPDDETGYPDRILFNVGRELFFYAFKSVWETPDLNRPLDRQVHKVQISSHDINRINLSQQGCSVVIGFVNGSFQIYDPRKETHLYNEDRLLDKGRVTCTKWLPGSTQQFLVGFASGQLFYCDDSLPWLATPPSYQMHKHGDGYAVYTCKSRQARNPAYRWMIGEGSLNAIGFSPCAKYLATASHDGFLRLFVVESMDLLGAAKSYFGGLLCLCWSPDSKFVCCAGEDDLVHLFSIESRKIVARGRGHRSWVTAVSFDSMTSCLAAAGTEPTAAPGDQRLVNGAAHAALASPSGRTADQPAAQRITTYRFASVGQDTQLCLWELTDDIVKQAAYSRLRAGSLMATLAISPVTSPPAAPVKSGAAIKRGIGLMGTRAMSSSSSSSGTKNNSSAVAAAAAAAVADATASGKTVLGSPLCPKLEEVPLLEPLVCKRIASERLNDIVFHEDCILISTQEGIIMNWCRPGRVPANNSSRHNSNCSN